MKRDHPISGHIYLSYRRLEPDSEFALRLANDLRVAGHLVWMDTAGVESEAGWSDEVKSALDACYAFIVALSPAAVESAWVRNEMLYALKHRPGLSLRVLLEPCELPPDLAGIEDAGPLIDFQGEYRGALSRLLHVLPHAPWDPTATAPSMRLRTYAPPAPTGQHKRYSERRPTPVVRRWWRSALALIALALLILPLIEQARSLVMAGLCIPPLLLGALAISYVRVRRWRVAAFGLIALGAFAWMLSLLEPDLPAGLSRAVGLAALLAFLLPVMAIWLTIDAARGREL